MKKRLSMILLVLSLYCVAMAQNSERPGWLSNKPKASNSTFVYVVERGTGATLNEATNNAILKVLRTTMMRIGSVVSWDEVNGAIQKGADWGTVAMRYNIPVNKVCEYVERKSDQGYAVAILCQVAKSGAVYPEFDDFTACSDTKSYNDKTALFQSVFVPGLGQMSKRHYGAGIGILTGEVVLLGGALGSYFMYQDQMEDGESDPFAKTFHALTIGCLVGAASLYIYNLISAYTMKPNYKSNDIVWSPILIPVGNSFSAGIGLTFNF